MNPEELNTYVDVFMVTLAAPFFVALLLVLGWAVLGGQSRADTIRRVGMGVGWTTASAVAVNFMYIDVFGRIALFGLMTLLGIGLYVFWEKCS